MKHDPDPHHDFRTVMHQEWRNLLFLHWPIEIEAIARLLPAPLELDTHDGIAYVGLVPFEVRRVRPPLLPPPPLVSHFAEINVRTYVRHGANPGVWFFSLDAGSRVAVAAARTFYHLPYFAADAHLIRDEAVFEFSSRRQGRPGSCRVRWRCVEPRTWHAEPGSLDEFLVERYALYTTWRGRLRRTRVDHVPYPLASAELISLHQDLTGEAGLAVQGEPPLVHYSPGVAPRVSGSERAAA